MECKEMKNEMLNVIMEGIRPNAGCEVIRAIAKNAASEFEEASEFIFENEEDDMIENLLSRLYLKEAYWEAVDMLYTIFTLVDMREAAAILDILGSCGSGDVAREFLEQFFEEAGLQAPNEERQTKCLMC